MILDELVDSEIMDTAGRIGIQGIKETVLPVLKDFHWTMIYNIIWFCDSLGASPLEPWKHPKSDMVTILSLRGKPRSMREDNVGITDAPSYHTSAWVSYDA